ncbi:Crp/Fnr family transcriptional regulator [Cutibacterium sp.]|uniref:Crp/Fnr family transcriptional regulator n=1 Tax=Cutibacterium sp. TaxID=1912221 RepID=UPI0026DAD27B|nr:Crp/Fnr family transcriptional regulator [Cutibacterium sp.]MDO4412715.1 Crp/Fnr family transcriptional regulator [Cutibacterium sp.]
MTTVMAAAATQPFFAALGPASAAQIMAVCETMVCPRNTVIFEAGDPANNLYLVVEGKVKLARSTPAEDLTLRESLLWLMGPDDMFGELSLVDGGTRSTTATTLTRCSLLKAPGIQVRELVETRHDVALAMLDRLSERLRRSDDKTAHFVSGDVPSRLAYTLLDLAHRFGKKNRSTGHIVVRHDLTQNELAQTVGSSRETVNKALTDFTKRGWIAARPKIVTIMEPEKLAARAS